MPARSSTGRPMLAADRRGADQAGAGRATASPRRQPAGRTVAGGAVTVRIDTSSAVDVAAEKARLTRISAVAREGDRRPPRASSATRRSWPRRPPRWSARIRAAGRQGGRRRRALITATTGRTQTGRPDSGRPGERTGRSVVGIRRARPLAGRRRGRPARRPVGDRHETDRDRTDRDCRPGRDRPDDDNDWTDDGFERRPATGPPGVEIAAATADLDDDSDALRAGRAAADPAGGRGRCWTAGGPRRRSRPTLARITALLDLLGNPQTAYPVIQIAGTNGKTSTARMIDALLTRSGLRTGRFTSPHLQSVTERISLDGAPIGESGTSATYADIAPYVDLVDAASRRGPAGCRCRSSRSSPPWPSRRSPTRRSTWR